MNEQNDFSTIKKYEYMTVGKRIKSLRETQQMSVETLAEQAGLEVNQVKTMESTGITPSIAPLLKIANALGVRLGTFWDDEDNIGPTITRKNSISQNTFTGKDLRNNSTLTFNPLACYQIGRHMEPFIINVNKNSDKGPVLSSHEGEEFLYILKGSVKIYYGKKEFILNEGDSIYYDSIVNHLVTAGNDENATILAVIYTPV